MKRVTFKTKARQGLKRGVDLIADAVKSTLGPRGRNVVYGFHYGYPVATKDGVTVARQVEATDAEEQLGVLLVREAAQKTADDTGDGTTTACVITQAIYSEGLKAIETGSNPVLVKRGIDKAVQDVVEFVEKNAHKITTSESTENVATISANNDRSIGRIIREAIEKVGKDGVITIEDNYSHPETVVEIVEGMQFNEGMLNPYFITNPSKYEAYHDDPYILIVDEVISSTKGLDKVAGLAISTQQRPLVVISHGISDAVLRGISYTRMKEGAKFPMLCIKAPQFAQYRSEMLIDLAKLTGGDIVGKDSGLSMDKVILDNLGECKSIRSDKFSTTFVGGKGSKQEIDLRIIELEDSIKSAKDDYHVQKCQERLAKLTSGVAVIKVGAVTEVEQKEKKMRVEDALHATKAALESGVVPGGGFTLFRASHALKIPENPREETIAYEIVKKVLDTPLLQIAENSGLDAANIIDEVSVMNFNWGYNFLTEKIVDLIETGVVDPVKVVVMALKNGASVAGMLLTTEVTIVEEREDEVTRTPIPKSE